MEQTNKIFVQFLKDNNVLKQYVKNVKCLRRCYFRTWENHTNPFTIRPLELCFNGVERIEDLIDKSFWWSRTPEGLLFWAKLDMEWRKYYCSHNTI